jgi:hypothetical protein
MLYVQSQVVSVFLSGTKKDSKGNKLKMIRLAQFEGPPLELLGQRSLISKPYFPFSKKNW